MAMTPVEFSEAIAKIVRENNLTHAQVASGLAGILVTMCQAAGEDPVDFMMWAVQESREVRLKREREELERRARGTN